MPRLACILASSLLCLPVCAQQLGTSLPYNGPVSSPHPYAVGSGVVWSHTYSSPGQTQARVELTIDLGAGDVLSLKDSAGVVQAQYTGTGPNVFAPPSGNDRGTLQVLRFQSSAIAGDSVTLELTGTSGGHGVDAHRVVWGSAQQTLAASTAGRCDMSQIVLPVLEDVEGASSSAFPWNRTAAMRVMYAHGQGSVDFDRTVRICAVRYRPDGGGVAGPVDYDFRMDVSTSRNPATSLNRDFDDNHGADRTTVFDGVLSAPGGPGGASPNAFELEVPFTTPFEWNPRSGALLIDIQYRGGNQLAGADFDQNVPADGFDVGRIANTQSASAVTANFPGTGTQTVAFVMELCQEVETVQAAGSGVELGSSSNLPFTANGSGSRVMYVYDSSEIDFTGRHRITALGWRPRNGSAFGGNTYDMRIRLSTGVNPIASTSTTFENNHGADVTTVFDGVLVAEPTPGGTAPNPFDLTVPLRMPFDYNPTNGPLIVDIQMRGHSSTSATTWDGLSGAGVFRVGNDNSPNATVGQFVNQFGLAMGLETEPCLTIPESDDVVFSNSFSSFPFNPGAASSGPQMRVQNVYDPVEIAPNGPLFIQHISWRPDSTSPTFGPVTYECTIDLSTAAVAASALDATFDNNHGADRDRVFEGQFSVPFVADTSNPSRFPIQVRLDTPFFYDPANGPLLLDIRMLGADGFTDVVDATGSTTQAFRQVHTTDPDAAVANFLLGNAQRRAYVIRVSGRGANALSTNYGSGCAGASGTPRAVNFSLPTLPNAEFSIGVTDTEANAPALVLLGLTQAAVPLAPFGAPGCTALQGLELGPNAVVTDASGTAELGLPLPNDPVFVGFTFQHQCAVLDAAANPLNLVFSDAQEHVTAF